MVTRLHYRPTFSHPLEHGGDFLQRHPLQAVYQVGHKHRIIHQYLIPLNQAVTIKAVWTQRLLIARGRAIYK